MGWSSFERFGEVTKIVTYKYRILFNVTIYGM